VQVKSTKTTVAGVAAAIALVAKAVSDAAADGLDFGDITLIAGAIALALQGIFARDDSVSSEGTRVVR